MHTAKIYKNLNIGAKSKKKLENTLAFFVRGPDGFQLEKSRGPKSLDTLPLIQLTIVSPLSGRQKKKSNLFSLMSIIHLGWSKNRFLGEKRRYSEVYL